MEALKDIYEKAGLFYLGKDVDKDSFKPLDILTLIKNKNFTTHAAIIGMTGSGKTGLGIGLIEEAAIDNIPAIIIDPKGDMGDLLLTDPEFSPQTFAKWVEDEAKAKGEDPLEYGKKIAKIWEDGIKSFHQDRERVKKFHQVEKVIYTPGSSAGVGINILSSLEVPNSLILEDSDNFSSYLSSTVSSLLSLIGIEGNLLNSKEYIFLAQIIKHSWQNNQSLTLESLVGLILNPPFKKVGVLPLESFYPEDKRFELANKFNLLIASPNFLSWMQGESLDIQKLLYTKDAKAKISIFSISHLNEKERMFFVTLLLNKIVAWMRMQSGTSRLRALLYMDEIYGYFPPTKNPPSKEPMMILLKQARAFGVGVVLSTQNPVDLDYKGLSNIGTWFIGRLQTKQDIKRVIDGLSGKIGSDFQKEEIENILTNLKKRVFFLKSAHLDEVRLFNTRWVLSYLKGPLKKDEIKELMAKFKQKLPFKEEIKKEPAQGEYVSNIIVDAKQRFEVDITQSKRYFPTIAAAAKLHYIDQRRGIDKKEVFNLYINLEEVNSCNWEESEELEEPLSSFPTKMPNGAKFKILPDFIKEDKNLRKCTKELKDYLYTHHKLELFRCKKLRVESEVGESYDDFLIRVQDILEEKKEKEIEKLKERYQKKFDRLNEQLQRALQKVEKEKADQTSSLFEAGISILSALFGKKSITKIGSAVNKSKKVLKERSDLSLAEQRVEELKEKISELEIELEEKIEEIYEKYSLQNYEIESFFIKPKKSLIDIDEVAILWRVEI